MTTTVWTGTAAALWQDLVQEASDRAAAALAEEQESYLVFTLIRHSRDERLLSRTLALELLDGMTLPDGGQRQDRLRDVGDRCLLLAGLFPAQARRRHVDESYYVDLGRGAYGELAVAGRDALAGLYAQLAEGFARLVRILRHVRLPPQPSRI